MSTTDALECWAVTCTSTKTRPYLYGPFCREHTPARTNGHPEPETLLDVELTAVALRSKSRAAGGYPTS